MAIEETRAISTRGADICKTLKRLYYPDASWSESVNKVAERFSRLKQATRCAYQDIGHVEFLNFLCRLSDQDVRDVLDAECE